MQYNDKKRYYYLDDNEAQELTGYQDLEAAGINSGRLHRHGRTLMRWLTSNVHNTEHIERQKPSDYIRYRIHKNENNEQSLIEDMLLEFIEWDYDVDGTRKIYEDNATYKDIVPITVQEIAYANGLKIDGDILFDVPEDEFEVGY